MRNPLISLAKPLARLRRFPTVARRRGATFILDPQNWIDNRLLAGARYENEQIAHAQRLIRDENISLFLDIGANFGLYSILLAVDAPGLHVHAFEPVKRNHAQLTANIFANRLDARVMAHRCGLSDEHGDATIHIDPTSTGVSRVDLTTAERAISVFTESELITLHPLDGLLADTGKHVFIKIDVEGHAPAVLRGMAAFLKNNRCFLQVELSAAENDEARALLRAAGYQEIRQIEADVIFARI